VNDPRWDRVGVQVAQGEYRYDRGRLVVDKNMVSFETFYRTDFSGRLRIEPPLDAYEVAFLHRSVQAAGASRILGPYGFIAPRNSWPPSSATAARHTLDLTRMTAISPRRIRPSLTGVDGASAGASRI
jgi:hypothetical protein